jgi:hypothetical protein
MPYKEGSRPCAFLLDVGGRSCVARDLSAAPEVHTKSVDRGLGYPTRSRLPPPLQLPCPASPPRHAVCLNYESPSMFPVQRKLAKVPVAYMPGRVFNANSTPSLTRIVEGRHHHPIILCYCRISWKSLRATMPSRWSDSVRRDR